MVHCPWKLLCVWQLLHETNSILNLNLLFDNNFLSLGSEGAARVRVLLYIFQQIKDKGTVQNTHLKSCYRSPLTISVAPDVIECVHHGNALIMLKLERNWYVGGRAGDNVAVKTKLVVPNVGHYTYLSCNSFSSSTLLAAP